MRCVRRHASLDSHVRGVERQTGGYVSDVTPLTQHSGPLGREAAATLLAGRAGLERGGPQQAHGGGQQHQDPGVRHHNLSVLLDHLQISLLSPGALLLCSIGAGWSMRAGVRQPRVAPANCPY